MYNVGASVYQTVHNLLLHSLWVACSTLGSQLLSCKSMSPSEVSSYSAGELMRAIMRWTCTLPLDKLQTRNLLMQRCPAYNQCYNHVAVPDPFMSSCHQHNSLLRMQTLWLMSSYLQFGEIKCLQMFWKQFHT